MVTAGPTREAIDPVRYLTNHSSGKMGYAIARQAANRGAEVIAAICFCHVIRGNKIQMLALQFSQCILLYIVGFRRNISDHRNGIDCW